MKEDEMQLLVKNCCENAKLILIMKETETFLKQTDMLIGFLQL